MPTLTICVTVDWEGTDLQDCNLNAMTMFRHHFPDIPLTHFICPAYLTRGGDLAVISDDIKSQIIFGDEIGLHIHCWKSLVQKADVVPRLAPSWYNDGIGPFVFDSDGGLDIGHGVPLGAYEEEEIEKIIACGRSLLLRHIANNNVGAITSFRCGGWMSADPVQNALENQKFRIDSSSTDASYFEEISQDLDNAGLEFGLWISDLWGNVLCASPDFCANSKTIAARQGGDQLPGGGALTQPYIIKSVMQVPDNGILADYLMEDMMYQRFKQAWESSLNQDIVHVCGFHQESAMGENIYGGKPNVDLFMRALRRFLKHVKRDTPQPDEDQTIPQVPSILIPGGPTAPTETRKIAFKTIRDASKLSLGDQAKRASQEPPLVTGGSMGHRHFG